MKKIFVLENLDCANCAAKIEEEIKKIDGVLNASVNFVSQKLLLETKEKISDEIINKIRKTIKKVESDIDIVNKDFVE